MLYNLEIAARLPRQAAQFDAVLTQALGTCDWDFWAATDGNERVVRMVIVWVGLMNRCQKKVSFVSS